MTTTPRRRLARIIRKARRQGYTKQEVLEYRDAVALSFVRIAEAAAPAIQYVLDLIAAEEPRPTLIHNGRKPR